MQIWLLLLFLITGCATKYIIPGNRFTTPESQGGLFHSSAEVQQSEASQLVANIKDNSVKAGVLNSKIKRTGFAYSTSFMEQLDLFWNHTGAGNSLLGGKYQFFGGSKLSKAVGPKMAFAAAFGGNEHETGGKPNVEFELSARDYQLLYGYRLSEFLLLYSNLSYSLYDFSGKIHSSDPSINGLKPKYKTNVMSLYGGTEISVGAFFMKGELGYQQLKTTDTKLKSQFIIGYALGLSW